MTNILQIKDLTYKKNNQIILKNINIALSTGKIIGLLGENGAGKTTLMRLITHLNATSTNNISVLGTNEVKEIKKMVSFNDHLDGFKSNKIENISDFYKNAYDDFSIKKFYEISEFLNLKLEDSLASLSTGTRGKLIIALTLARSARLYLLDEPLSGIDVMSRKKIISSIIRWKSDESSLIVSDHYISGIANLLDEIVILKDTKIIKQISVEDIQEKYHLGIEDYYEKIYEEN